MLKFLQEYDYLIVPYITQIARAFLIPFSALGVVYAFGRMLDIARTDRSRNIIAIIVIVIMTFLTGNFDGSIQNMLSFNYIIGSFEYVSISIIIYVLLCWKLYSRIDSLLDKKVGEDKKEEDERKRKIASDLRKAKKEKKKLEEENKKLERSKKRLTKKE